MDKTIEFDLASEAPTDRVRAWKRLLDECVMGVECRNAGDDMRATLTSRLVDAGSINRATFTRQTLSRTPALIAATVIVPTLPMDDLSLGLISSLDDMLRDDVPAAKAEGLATDILDLLAMTIASDGLAPARSLHLMPRRPVH